MSSVFYSGTANGTCDNTFTVSTSGDVTSTLTPNDTNTVWFPHYMESTWLPYHYTLYKPEWHIIQGYKNQFKSMWD